MKILCGFPKFLFTLSLLAGFCLASPALDACECAHPDAEGKKPKIQWVKAPATIACDGKQVAFQYKVTVEGCASFWSSLHDQDTLGDNDLIKETYESGSLTGKKTVTVSSELWCDTDCSELNGAVGDSDENPTDIFGLIESYWIFSNLCDTPIHNVTCGTCVTETSFNWAGSEEQVAVARVRSTQSVVEVGGEAMVRRAGMLKLEPVWVTDILRPGDTIFATESGGSLVLNRLELEKHAAGMPEDGVNRKLHGAADEVLAAHSASVKQQGRCYDYQNTGLQVDGITILPFDQYESVQDVVAFAVTTNPMGWRTILNADGSAGRIAVLKPHRTRVLLGPGETMGMPGGVTYKRR